MCLLRGYCFLVIGLVRVTWIACSTAERVVVTASPEWLLRFQDGARVFNMDDPEEYHESGSATVIGYDITREVYIVELDEWTAPRSEWHQGRDTWMCRETHLASRQPYEESSGRAVFPGVLYFIDPHKVPGFTGRPVEIVDGPNEFGMVSVKCVCVVHVGDLQERIGD